MTELRTSRARLVEASDLDRERLERELHEGVHQQLVALSIKVALARDVSEGDAPLRRRLGQLQVAIDDALDGLREVSQELVPPLLADEGLIPALRAAAVRCPLRVHVEAARDAVRPPAAIEAAVYYCCAEALQNAADHAGPNTRVSMKVATVDGNLRFSVEDDGSGFDPSTTADGRGFASMRDRVGGVGGKLTIESASGRGTLVSGAVPT